MSLNRKSAAIRRVFEHWQKFQPRPDGCRMTDTRRDLISNRLRKGHTEEDLIALITYAYEADTDEAQFWRGDNDRERTYLGLDNLLRSTKLPDRVDRAIAWASQDDDDDDDDSDVILDPVAMMLKAAREGR